jgi:heme o synthase
MAIISGTALVIASGCVFNNYIDRTIDAKMERTRKRAFVKRNLPVRAGLGYASALGFLGFLVLIVGTNLLTVLIGLIGYVFYIVIYGIAKRKTHWGTLIGSISGSVPPVAGYTAYAGMLDKESIVFFLILVCWQMAHFYSIALYRQKDYAAAGLPVWPVAKSPASTRRQIIFFILAYIAASLSLSIWGSHGFIYALVTIGIGGAWLYKAWQWRGMKSPAWGRKMFGFSLLVMMGFSLFIPLGALLK